MHSSDTAQLVFEDVRVPAKNLIGEEGSGFIYQMIQFQQERIFGEFWRKLLFRRKGIYLTTLVRNIQSPP